MDFEIDDGLDKLKKASLLNQSESIIKAESLAEANIKLQQQWCKIIDHTPVY